MAENGRTTSGMAVASMLFRKAGSMKENLGMGCPAAKASGSFPTTGTLKANGRVDGHAVAVLPENPRYDGDFKDGILNGFGAMIYPDGRREEICWPAEK